MAKSEARRSFAEKIFKDEPSKVRQEMQKPILAQQIVIGMSPYEAYLAGGAFAFRVIADLDKWKVNEDPYNIMWAQSTHPDNSQIWMTFKNTSQFSTSIEAVFRVFFQNGKAIEIKKNGEK